MVGAAFPPVALAALVEAPAETARQDGVPKGQEAMAGAGAGMEVVVRAMVAAVQATAAAVRAMVAEVRAMVVAQAAGKASKR